MTKNLGQNQISASWHMVRNVRLPAEIRVLSFDSRFTETNPDPSSANNADSG